jgi:hypothetical protein
MVELYKRSIIIVFLSLVGDDITHRDIASPIYLSMKVLNGRNRKNNGRIRKN